jgi:hypothetical protein
MRSLEEGGRGTYGIGPSYWSDIFEVDVLEYESRSLSALDISFLLLFFVPVLLLLLLFLLILPS